ncbi:MAG: ArsA family ATPase [Candidatus Thorarchaeota archaeon]|nr:ArsA family ATPase [Candidatus Thorarchaeota archaeon]
MTIRDIVFNPNVRFILSGGKGGVGKTSCAGAIAVLSARHGLRTLVISTDPAHSLSDSFDQNLSGGEIIPIEGFNNLWGMEINTEKGMKEFQDSLSGASPGPEMEMATQFLGGMEGMTPPGSDEAMAFGKMLEFIGDNSYDRVVFDTAPTGHTLKLLELPDLLDTWLGKILTLRQRLSGMFSGLRAMMGGEPQEDNSWEMLQQTKEKIRAARVELSDPEVTQFVVVMIPEAMALFETQRLIASLNTWHIPVSNLIVNQLVPPNPTCAFCSRRHEMQKTNMADIREIYHDLDIVEVPLFDREIRGTDGLMELGRILVGEEDI